MQWCSRDGAGRRNLDLYKAGQVHSLRSQVTMTAHFSDATLEPILLLIAEPVFKLLLISSVLVSRILPDLFALPDIFTLLSPSVKYNFSMLSSVSMPDP